MNGGPKMELKLTPAAPLTATNTNNLSVSVPPGRDTMAAGGHGGGPGGHHVRSNKQRGSGMAGMRGVNRIDQVQFNLQILKPFIFSYSYESAYF